MKPNKPDLRRNSQGGIDMEARPGLIVNRFGDTLSLAQGAFLFSLSRRGSAVSAVGIRREACVLSAALSELVFRGILLPHSGDRLVFSGKKPPEYLLPLCSGLENGSVLELEALLDALLFAVPSSAVLTQLNLALGDSLALFGLVGRQTHRTQVLFPPCRPALNTAAEQLQNVLLSGAPLSAENSVLCYLLNATGLWNGLFSRKELLLMRRSVPKIDHALPGRILTAIDRMDGMLAAENFCAC